MNASADRWNSICKDVNRRLQYLSRFQGCLIGGAVGDALGYPVEFMSFREIQHNYGAEGLTEDTYHLTGDIALISDDTQMTLFTANALLVGDTRGSLRGVGGPSYHMCRAAYQDWLHTQDPSVEPANQSWLLTVKELHALRAPGRTCIRAIRSGMNTKKDSINGSKGCGGVMRVAPFGLFWSSYRKDRGDRILEHAAKEAAFCAALTHGHPLGFISAGAFAYIICRCVTEIADDAKDADEQLRQIVLDCCDQLRRWFFGYDEHTSYQSELLRQACELSKNHRKDVANIRELGEGWVGEETLAIAVYASLRHMNSFSSAIFAAANHGGDSDSTASLTGQIIGAARGLQSIDGTWLENLELRSVIMEIAHDLCIGCQMSEYGDFIDEQWMLKYGDSCTGSMSINDQLRGNVREQIDFSEIEAIAAQMDPQPKTDRSSSFNPSQSEKQPAQSAPQPRTYSFTDFNEVVDDKTAEYYEFDFGESYVKVDRKNLTYYALDV